MAHLRDYVFHDVQRIAFRKLVVAVVRVIFAEHKQINVCIQKYYVWLGADGPRLPRNAIPPLITTIESHVVECRRYIVSLYVVLCII